MAVQRMIQAGVTPVTWWSLAAEFQLEPRFAGSPIRMQLMSEFQPAMTMGGRVFSAGVGQGRFAAAGS